MSPKILSLLCITSLLVFIQTDWLPKLASDLKVSQNKIQGFLFVSLVLTILPSFPHSSFIQVEPVFFSSAFLFFYLLKHSSFGHYISLIILSLFAGSTLFLFHEWRQLSPYWGNLYLPMIIFILLCLLSLFFSSQLKDQLLICLGGMGVLYGWITLFRYEMLKPLIIGNDEYVDTTWFCLTGMVIVHYSFHWLVELFDKRKKIGAIFRWKEGD